jgi:hypothetical protein
MVVQRLDHFWKDAGVQPAILEQLSQPVRSRALVEQMQAGPARRWFGLPVQELSRQRGPGCAKEPWRITAS